MKDPMRTIAVFLFFCVFAVILPAGTWAADGNGTDAATVTYNISPNAGTDCTDGDCDLQSALNMAAAGDAGSTFVISSGTFTDPAVISTSPQNNTPLEINGSGINATVFEGGLYIDTTGMADDSNATITLKDISFMGDAGIVIKTNAADIVIGNLKGKNVTLQTESGNIILDGLLNFEGEIRLCSGPAGQADGNSSSGGSANGLTISSGIGGTPVVTNVGTGNVPITANPGSSIQIGDSPVILNPEDFIAYISYDGTAVEGKTFSLGTAFAQAGNNEDDGGIWVQTSGPTVVLSDPSDPNASFVTPAVGSDGADLAFERRVSAESDQVESGCMVHVQDNGISGFPSDAVTFSTIVPGVDLGIRLDGTGCALTKLNSIAPASVDTAGEPEDMVFGLVDMEIKVATPGDTVSATIFFPEPAPAGYRWYKFSDAAGWQDFSDHAVFSEDRTRVTLTLTDGGPGDEDGVADGLIHDPSGLGLSVQSNAGTSGSGSGGCFIETLVGEVSKTGSPRHDH